METSDISSDVSDIQFGGSKPRDDTITDITINNPFNEDEIPPAGDSDQPCDYGTNATSWDCSYLVPEGGFDPEQSPVTIKIELTTAGGTQVAHFLSFDFDNESEDPANTGYAEGELTFLPGTFTATVNPFPTDDYAAIEYFSEGEGGSGGYCPADANGEGSFDFSQLVRDHDNGQQSCTRSDTSSAPEFQGEGSDGGSVWEVRTQQGDTEGARTGESSPEVGFVAFSAPTITSVADGGNGTVVVKGTGGFNDTEGGNSVAAIRIYDENGDAVCNVPTDGDEWSCTTTNLGVGTHTLKASLVDNGAGRDDFNDDFSEENIVYVTGAMSPFSNSKTITFAAPAVIPSSTATPTAAPWTFTIEGIDPNNMQPGDTFTINGTGLPSGTTIDAEIHSTPEDLGSTVVGSDGSFSLPAKVPADLPAGAHTIIVTASGTGVTTQTQQQAVTLVPAATSGSGSGTKPTKPSSGKPTVIHTTDTSTAPNILTNGLQPFAEVAAHPNKIVSAVEIGLVLLLLAAFPAHLLESTIAEQSERFERRFRGRRTQPRWIASLVAWFKRAPVAAGVIVTTATAILFGFADPNFGFTLASLRLVLAAAIALFLVGFVANALTGVIARAAWKVEAEIHTRPWGLILTVVGVLLSRVLHFAPGFLIGLILGLAIEGRSARGYAWRLVATRAAIVLTMGILAWVGYSLLTLNGSEGGSFGSDLLVETLVAITTEGVVALLVELLPLRFLEGERIYAKSRILWGAMYLITLAIFVIAVVPWEGNWDALGSSLWIWIGALVLFALICIGIYVYFRRFAKPLEEEEGDEEVALGETVAGDRS